MDEARGKRRNLAIAFYDYRKAYDMVSNDWMLRVYRWVGVPEKVVNLLSQLMEGWKTRLEVTDKGKVKTSRWKKYGKDSYKAIAIHQCVLLNRSTDCNDVGGNRWED